jgi:hypothetical protein
MHIFAQIANTCTLLKGALLACARACTVLSSDRLAGDGTSMWAKVLSAVWCGALIFDRIAFYKLGTLFFESSL